MISKLKRIFAFILMLVFVISPLASISHAEKGEEVQTETGNFSISRQEVVVGNEVTVDYLSENGEKVSLFYETPTGEEIVLDLNYDEDSGINSSRLILDEPGEYKVTKAFINDEKIPIENLSLNINVYSSVRDQFGQEGPLIIEDEFQNDSKIVISDLDEIIRQVYGVDENGNIAEISVRIQGNGIDETIAILNDGSSVISDENSSAFTPGKYTLTYSIEGGQSIVKETTIVSDVADSNFSRLSGEEVQLSAGSQVLRVSGKTRYETAVQISRSTFRTSDSVVIANGQVFADALSSTAFAYQEKSPILYGAGKSLSQETQAEVKRLQAKKAYIIGGYTAVSREIQTQLTRMGLTVERVAGTNRFETSIAVGKKLTANSTSAILTNSHSFADALSAGAYSAKNGLPLLYTTKDRMEAKTMNMIKASGINKVFVVGGSGVISDTVVRQLTQAGINVERISGSNRYETSVVLANKFYGNPSSIVMASGGDFADALAGGVLAAVKGGPVVLANDNLASSTRNYVYKDSIKTIFMLGGEKALSTNIFSELSTDKNPTPTPKPQPKPAPKPTPQPTPPPSTGKKTVRIMLDPGHGAGVAHNRGFVGGNEGDSNWYYHRILKEELERRGFIVGTTRPRITDNPELAARGQAGRGYDLFLSLHTNATGTATKASGTEIYDDTNPKYSNKALADKLGKAIASSQGIRYRGTFYRRLSNGTNYYGVLRNNEAKNGFLVEHCFHDNPSEIRFYVNNYRKVAIASANALAEYYGMK